ncbi:synaptotagmin II [Aureococcus anophagefferens]|nr:synaptotagmin II [Aureococcus anophagefferens]
MGLFGKISSPKSFFKKKKDEPEPEPEPEPEAEPPAATPEPAAEPEPAAPAPECWALAGSRRGQERHVGPFVSVQLVETATGKALKKPHDKARKTNVVKKTLAPRFADEAFVFDDAPLQCLQFQVFDWNAGVMGIGSGKAKPLGVCSVDLQGHWDLQPDLGPDGQGAPMWLKLLPLATEKEKKGRSSIAAAGDLEVKFVLTAGTGDANADAALAADKARWFLKIADKNTFGGGGSSDPFVTLTFGDGKPVKTKVVKKNLEPVWMESFELAVPLPKDKKKDPSSPGKARALPSLTVLVEDKDALTSDFLGKCSKGEPAADRGQVQLALKMVYDAANDPSEDRPFFLDGPTLAEHEDRDPNELRVAVCRARDLKAMDAAVPFSSVGKTSDPYVKVELKQHKGGKTKTKKKTLAPVWNETFAFDLAGGSKGAQSSGTATEDAPEHVDFHVYDHDLIGSDDFLGLACVPLATLLEAKHKPVTAWYPLGEKSQRAGGDGSLGAVMLCCQWRYNVELDFRPFCDADDAHADKPPNEVRVALFRGRGLAIKDKNLLSSGGSSDPRVRFVLLGGAVEEDPKRRKKQEKERTWKSSTRKKTLDPIWREVFARELRPPKEDDLAATKNWSPPLLRCICEDVDELTSADFMGQLDIALEALIADRPTVDASWRALAPDPDGKASSNVTGELHVAVQWRFNPELEFDPWVDDALPGNPERPPNELRVVGARPRPERQGQARALGPGSSDPRVTFKVIREGGVKGAAEPLKPWKSKTVSKSLSPSWNETYGFDLLPPQEGEPPWVLRCICEDIDELTSADFMGQADVALAPLGESRARSRDWHELVSADGGSSNVTGELEIVTQWHYNPALDFDPWADEAVDAHHGTKRLKCKSKTIKKSLDPSWRETFSLELPEGEYMEGETKIDFGANGPILEVTIEDVDELTSADFMGELNIPLEPLKKQRTRAWHPLQADAEGKHKSSNVCGEVELVLYWTYNEALDFDPFLEEDVFPEKPSNELRIGLAQGRNLAIRIRTSSGPAGPATRA